jgi:hypothetical protein
VQVCPTGTTCMMSGSSAICGSCTVYALTKSIYGITIWHGGRTNETA